MRLRSALLAGCASAMLLATPAIASFSPGPGGGGSVGGGAGAPTGGASGPTDISPVGPGGITTDPRDPGRMGGVAPHSGGFTPGRSGPSGGFGGVNTPSGGPSPDSSDGGNGR